MCLSEQISKETYLSEWQKSLNLNYINSLKNFALIWILAFARGYAQIVITEKKHNTEMTGIDVIIQAIFVPTYSYV